MVFQNRDVKNIDASLNFLDFPKKHKNINIKY